MTPNPAIAGYNAAMPEPLQPVADWLAATIDAALPEAAAKVWHRTAVWFLSDNPVVGYAPRKAGVQLLFWSGQSFAEPGLKPEGKFKAAEAWLQTPGDVDPADLGRWLGEGADDPVGLCQHHPPSRRAGKAGRLVGYCAAKAASLFSRLWRKRQPARG